MRLDELRHAWLTEDRRLTDREQGMDVNRILDDSEHSMWSEAYYTVGKYLVANMGLACERPLHALRGIAHPLVNTFNSDVFPHAPSPLLDMNHQRVTIDSQRWMIGVQ